MIGGMGNDGIESCGLGSGTATGEVNATASREAKMIDVAAMMCGVMRKFRVSRGLGCNLNAEDIGSESKIEGIRHLFIYKSPSSQFASLILKEEIKEKSPPICAGAFNQEGHSCAR